MLIKVSDFGGIAPVNDRSKLPNYAARTALNCKFEGGNLHPRLAASEAYGITTQIDDVKTIFQIGDNQFLRWYGIVSAVKGPTPIVRDYLTLGDDFRIYYAGDTGHGTRWPRFTSKFRAMEDINISNFFDGPALEYPLGVPAPEAGPTCSASAAPSGTISAITVGAPPTCVCTAPHGLSTGTRVLLTGLPGSGSGSELNGVSFAVSVLGASSFKLDSVDTTEWEGAIAGAFTWTRVYADSEVEDRIYVYTYVNEFGEEGPPSAPSGIVSVGEGQSVSVVTSNAGTITPANSPQFTVTMKRIYRSVSGSDSAQYLFVAEQLVEVSSYIDSVSVEALGEVLSTEDYALPPAYLENIVLHPNGFLIGNSGNRIYCSEPYLPYAWPTAYIKTLDHSVRGIAIYGSTVVVGTDNQPYVGSATDPASLTFRRLEEVYPCISGRSMVSTGGSVAFVAPNGLVVVDEGGARVATLQYYSVELWSVIFNSLVSSTIACAWHDGMLWLTNGSETLSIDLQPERTNIAQHTFYPASMFVDRDDRTLYYVAKSNSSANRKLMAFEGGSSYQTMDWYSKQFHTPREISMVCAQVFAESYDSGNGATLRLTVTATDGSSVNYNVTSKRPFWLRSGFLSNEWSFAIRAATPVRSVQIAQSIEELRQAAL